MRCNRLLLLATGNAGKAAEFRSLLPPGVTVLNLTDLSLTMPPETGNTFAENAAAKALYAARQTGHLTLADDSGLEVDALGGDPGVQSARYAGTPVSDAKNREKLLAAMLSIPEQNRTARFRCVVALAYNDTILQLSEGTREGHIGTAPRGDGGFGYDSVFVLPGGRTMAELPMHEKNTSSHRGQAYQAILPRLRQELDTLSTTTSEN
ncbi:MAG: RdgB/HAM1 family non-canonical purine NTP pyrophosphatase [Thermomicrobiales bacterium]